MRKFRLMAIAICFGLLSCSEEKSEPLPELPPVEIPSDVSGTYSGQLPCDDCKAQMVRAILSADSSATVVRTLVQDSIVVDTLQGKFSVGADSVVSIAVGDGRYSWKFKRSAIGNLALMNGSGEIYVDEDSLKCELIRLFVTPKTKAASVDVDSSKKVSE